MFKKDHTSTQGKVVSVMSPRGGTGKTTVSLLLSTHLANIASPSTKVCLVDLDINDSQLGHILGKQTPTINDLPPATKLNKKTLNKHLVYSEDLGVHVLLSKPGEELEPEFYEAVIQKLRTMFDVVVLDTGAPLEDINIDVVVPVSDYIFAVIDDKDSSLKGFRHWVTAMTGSPSGGASGEKMRVVFNNMTTPVTWNIWEMEEMLGTKIATLLPHSGADFVYDASTLNFTKMLTYPKMGISYEKMSSIVLS